MARMARNNVSSLVGQLEIKVDIKASAQEFFHMFARRPDLLSNVSPPSSIQSCDVLDGEYGIVGSTILWNYVLDGKVMVAKDMIEAVDLEKNLITLRILEGDLREQFKSFLLTLQVTPKRKGPGSIVRYHLEYEKINEEVADPEAILQMGNSIFMEIDKHLLSEQ